MDSLAHADQTRYFYLRGMNNFRMGKDFRADARHWLALARAHEQQMAGGLTPEWKERLEEALKDLNQDVYGTGVVADAPKRDEAEGDEGDKKAKSRSPEAEEDDAEPKPKPKAKKKKKAAED